MKCTQCGGSMKPLFLTWFCPKDCDRPRLAVQTSTMRDPAGVCKQCNPQFRGTAISCLGICDVCCGCGKTIL